jgi:AcrR family transcriptional regulator
MYSTQMSPPRGDHDARRRDVAEAVWRVLADRGFGQLTLRAVAEAMGVSTGLLTHYFPTKRALVRYAHNLTEERTDGRALRVAEPGLPSLRAALLDVLPVTPEALAMSRVWVSFWDAAIGDPELGASHTARYERWRGRLRPFVEEVVDSGEFTGDVDDLVATVAAFAHGLVVQALFDPDRFPPDRQVRLLDDFLATVRNTECPSKPD